MTRTGPEVVIGPGFQGSETSGIQLALYPHGDDPVISDRGDLQATGPIFLNGTRNHSGEAPSIIRMTYSFNLGEAAPQFSVSYKDPNELVPVSSMFLDDDWVDLSLVRHGEPYILMRGILDGPPRVNSTVQADATSRTYTLTGRGFGAVWDKTPVYLNAAIGELADYNAAQALASAEAFGGGTPSETTEAFLFHFLRQLGDSTVGTSWQIPPGMPGIGDGRFFNEVVEFLRRSTADQPNRFSILPGFYPDFTGNTLWDLGQQWSDPHFNELLPVLVNKNTKLRPLQDEVLSPEEAGMAVLMRRRPFPYVDDLDTWFGIEMVEITPQDIKHQELAQNGAERFNSFVVKTKGYLEFLGILQEVLTSQINVTDVRRHGLRRMEVTSNYAASGADTDILGVVEEQRKQIRDWFSLNPYYFSGTMDLGRGFPEIQPGYRLRVLGQDEEEHLTFYVEGVRHSWDLVNGLKTSVMVSRGWKGSDQSYKEAIREAADRFVAATTLGGNG